MKNVAAGLALLSVCASGVKVNDINTHYVVESFNFNEFPMAVGWCNPKDVNLASGYIKATCLAEDMIQIDTYNTGDPCEGSPIVTQTLNSSYQTGMGSYQDFNCDDDGVAAYVDVGFTTAACDDDTASFVDFKAAVATCAFVGAPGFLATTDTSIQAWCNDTNAELQYWDGTANGEAGNYVGDCTGDTINIAFVEEDCTYMLTTSGLDISGYLSECYLGGDSASADDDDTGDDTGDDAGDDDDDDDDSAFAFGSMNCVFIVLSAFIASMFAQ